MILVGIIPGPREPKRTINSFLAPLVKDLEAAWSNGLTIATQQGRSITVRLAVSCVACDIPASRKVCGFLGHNAALGCNKCLKRFPRSGQVVDYSGYDRDSWAYRNVHLHRQQCRDVLKATTKSAMRKAESAVGLRYTCLLDLIYFDPVHFTIVDVMHNLFLGTGKHIFKLWLSLELLSKLDLANIESRIGNFSVPGSVGRLPSNISSNHGGFTANQWQSWIVLYSPVVLKGILDKQHYNCWLLFVRACSLLCGRIITYTEIDTADLLLLNFCKKVEQLYGRENCTPNLHLHLHLKQCLLDYGPSHAFWLYSFERYNGLLGSYHTNKKSIEIQIMRKFVDNQRLTGLKYLAKSEFLSVLPNTQNPFSIGIENLVSDDNAFLALVNMSTMPLPSSSFSCHNNNFVKTLPPFYEDVFSYTLQTFLASLYSQLYPDHIVETVSPFFVRCGRTIRCGQLIGSVMNRSSANSSAVITAFWPSRDQDLNHSGAGMKVGIVQYFLKHQVTLCNADNGKKKCEHVMAYVKWKERHAHEDWFGISAKVCINTDEPSCMFSFIPVHRIHSVCVHSVLDVEITDRTEEVFVAVPIPVKYCL